ncbi:MAG TPA: hypothetical protein VD908_00465 [Cytophagales bacterium]|nr:hypothetical protein [Cytophagales bacterium]
MEDKLQSVIIIKFNEDNLFKGYKITKKNTWSDFKISPDRMEKSDFVYAKITGTEEYLILKDRFNEKERILSENR